ncbi:MAG: hypothetical protein Q8942_03180 [Bacillota bacterium]|nr:hypothetical protein [Bacillota bacterium]
MGGVVGGVGCGCGLFRNNCELLFFILVFLLLFWNGNRAFLET